MEKHENDMVCKCTHHKFVPLVVILFALTFLLGALDVLGARTVSVIWPILVGVVGLMKLTESRCKCC